MNVRFFFLCIALIGMAHADARPKLELQCVSIGEGPALECTARLQNANGEPIKTATVTLAAHMPSMPMAHSIKPVVAVATNHPGEYRTQLELEMPGVWAIQVDLSAPNRDRFIRRMQVERCEKGKRCPALATSLTTSKP